MKIKLNYMDWYKCFASAPIGLLAHARHYRFSNFSAVRIPGSDELLYAVKCLFIDRERHGFFRPGNAPGTAYSEDTGIDFWWNRWGESRGGVVYFIGNPAGALRVLQVDPYSDARSFRGVQVAGDIRLYSGSDGLFAYDSELRVYRISINGERLRLSYFTSAACGIDDRNMSLLGLNPLVYLDWFRDRGLVLKRSEGASELEHVLPYEEKYRLRGSGSCLGDIYSITPYSGLNYEQFLEQERSHFGDNFGITPHLCFGSPGVIVTHPTLGDGFLGVGHSKIWNNPGTVYRDNSFISNFRQFYHLEMRKHFGDCYIKHFGRGGLQRPEGFLYLLFFYFVKSDFSRCYLSNSFLPFARKELHGPGDRDYHFGLVFPLSLLPLSSKSLAVTMGVGDWYSVWCEFETSEIFDALNHDTCRLDMSKYRYQLICPESADLPASLQSLL